MAEVEDETPMDTQSESVLAHTERIFLRLTLLQTVLSVAGVFIAVVALYAALTESSAVRQQTSLQCTSQTRALVPRECGQCGWQLMVNLSEIGTTL